MVIIAIVIHHVPKTRDAEKRKPEIVALNGRFLNLGSMVSMIQPIHRIGWGRNNGSPMIKSRINAAGRTYHEGKKSIYKS